MELGESVRILGAIVTALALLVAHTVFLVRLRTDVSFIKNNMVHRHIMLTLIYDLANKLDIEIDKYQRLFSQNPLVQTRIIQRHPDLIGYRL